MARPTKGIWSAASRRRLSRTRKRLFAAGVLRGGQNKKEEIPDVAVSDDFGFWFAGIVDGEGCFTVTRKPSGGIQPWFCLSLRRDDLPTIEMIQDNLGFGTITFTRPKGRNPVARFAVQSRAGCVALVRLFRKYSLRSKKVRDFLPWARIVERAFRLYNPKYNEFKSDLLAMKKAKKFSQENGSGER